LNRVGLLDELNASSASPKPSSQKTGRRKLRARPQNHRKLPGKTWGILLLCGIGFISLIWWLPQYQRIQELNLRIAELEKRKLEIQAVNQRLQEEITWLGTDAAVERLAREELGMVKPGERVLLDLEAAGD
jgi:cell division protein FtsB